MARILTGVQSTGTPHLGNILGAILPAIEMSNDNANDAFLFIADLHSLTQIKNAQTLAFIRELPVTTSSCCYGLGCTKIIYQINTSGIPHIRNICIHIELVIWAANSIYRKVNSLRYACCS